MIEFIILWVVCSVVAAGMWVGYFMGKYGDVCYFRAELAHGLLAGLIGGPFSLFVGFFFSEFCRYGWRLWPKEGDRK